jgi:hypothetical protein
MENHITEITEAAPKTQVGLVWPFVNTRSLQTTKNLYFRFLWFFFLSDFSRFIIWRRLQSCRARQHQILHCWQALQNWPSSSSYKLHFDALRLDWRKVRTINLCLGSTISKIFWSWNDLRVDRCTLTNCVVGNHASIGAASVLTDCNVQHAFQVPSAAEHKNATLANEKDDDDM